mmetsp:Transcript_35520/g.43520  ORF Transcript_35520/g.43520 Transcript_35520/m.43520 type:complete len:194 (-) Transcript_35520:65-646(-)
MMTSNAHLLIFPATTAAFHYLYMHNHLSKMTLYYDMQKLGTDENYVATFASVKKVLMTDPRLRIYVEQGIEDEQVRDRTLIFENPIFQPFAHKAQGMMGRIDEDRRRFEFECVFRDLIRDSQGRIQALIIFNRRNEAYFESLTIKMEKPKVEVIRVVERDIDPAEGSQRWNRPTPDKGESMPKEKPKSKYSQF